jgi:23S rRNA pseudouridine2605 synthase
MGTPLILCNFVVLIYAMSKNQEEGNKFNLNDRKPVGKDRGNNSPENNSEARGSENRRRDDSSRRDSGFSREGGRNEKREGFGGDRRGGSSDRDRRPGGFGGDRDRKPGGFGGDRDRREGGFNRGEKREGFGGDRERRGGTGDRDRRPGGFGGDRDRKPGGFGGDRDRRDGGFNRGEKREGFGGDRERRGGTGDRDRRPGGFGGDRDRKPGGFGGDRDRRDGGFNRGEKREGFGGDRDRREGSGDRAYSKDFKKIKGKTFDTKNPYADSDANGSNERSKPKKVKRERIESKSVKAGFGYKGANRDLQKHGEGLQKGSRLLQEEIRLNRYISNSGLCSRREADALIAQGLVQVNGNVVTELGSKVGPKDVVKVEGRRIMPEKPVYILLNKPKGYITTTDDPDGRKTVMDLIDLPGKERIYPVGRLDRNTTGVLLLTNDGEFAQKMTHPSFEIKKIYRAKLDRKPSKENMLAWVEGIDLEDGFMNFEQVGFVDENDPSILGVEIHSGRNRIVRRMFEHFKYEVEALDRVLIGEFDKLKLGRGKWRFLSDKEVAYVERLKRQKPKKIEPRKVIDPDKMDFSFGSMDFSEE